MSRMQRLVRRLAQIRGRGAGAGGSGHLGFADDPEDQALSSDLERNEQALRAALGDSFDLTFRRLRPSQDGPRLMVIYIRQAVDERLLSEGLLEQLASPHFPAGVHPPAIVTAIQERFAAVGTVQPVSRLSDAIDAVLGAHVLLLVDGAATALDLTMVDWPSRGVLEPETEVSIRGTRDGFSNCIMDNTAIVRKIIRSPDLRFVRHDLGRRTKTVAAVAYMDGLASPALVEDINGRLTRIRADRVLESGFIEELIKDRRWTPFPLVLRTERPDRVAAGLLRGRVAIISDGTPFVLVLPATLAMFLTAADDWYEGFVAGSAIRAMRYAAFVLSLLLPALYVAVTSFHQEMVPSRLVLSIANQRQGIPFPVMAEALTLQIIFELLREAGVRLPKAVGQAVTIVGALIVGQQAVEAGLVSPVMVIIIALTGICSFATPMYSLSLSVRVLGPLFIVAGGLMGLFGVLCMLLVMVVHLSGLESYGEPYTAPLAPLEPQGLKDSVVRWPIWSKGGGGRAAVRRTDAAHDEGEGRA
jgi:spore germination protein KA